MFNFCPSRVLERIFLLWEGSYKFLPFPTQRLKIWLWLRAKLIKHWWWGSFLNIFQVFHVQCLHSSKHGMWLVLLPLFHKWGHNNSREIHLTNELSIWEAKLGQPDDKSFMFFSIGFMGHMKILVATIWGSSFITSFKQKKKKSMNDLWIFTLWARTYLCCHDQWFSEVLYMGMADNTSFQCY